MQCKRRFIEGHVAEEGLQGGQAIVSCPGAVASFTFEMLKELSQEGHIKVLQAEFRRHASEVLRGKTEQQAEGIPVGGNRVRARAKLSEQPVCEETLEQGWKAHWAPPRWLICSVAR